MKHLGLAQWVASEKVNHCKINMENQDDYLSTLEELEAARNHLANYQSLLKDLPELYERKFEERLRPIREHNRALSQEGEGLRQQLNQALPAANQPQRQGLPAASDAPMAAQFTSTAKTPVIPSARSRTLLPIGLAGAASLLLLATLRPLASWMNQFNPIPSKLTAGSAAKIQASATTLSARKGLAHTHLVGGSPDTNLLSSAHQSLPSQLALGTLAQIHPKQETPVSMAAPGELILRASAPTWLEVQDSNGHPLMAETFKGQRRIPLGQGLLLLAGRPDLITIQIPGTPPRRLGKSDAVGWQTIKPNDPHSVPASNQSDAPASLATGPSTQAGRSVYPTLVVQSSEPSWLEVRSINKDPIYAGLLSGQRRFPLGKGLEVSSGRADAVSIAIDQAVPKRLGSSDDLSWHRFLPPASGSSAGIPPISASAATATQARSANAMGAGPKASISFWNSLGISSFFSPRQPAKVLIRQTAANPDRDRDQNPSAEALILRASEPTWLEVRDANDRSLVAETFQGTRRIPLGEGLSLLAGRPDLLTVQRQGKPPEPLGRIEDLRWFRFSPASKPRSAT